MTAVAGGNLWSPAPQPNDDDGFKNKNDKIMKQWWCKTIDDAIKERKQLPMQLQKESKHSSMEPVDCPLPAGGHEKNRSLKRALSKQRMSRLCLSQTLSLKV